MTYRFVGVYALIGKTLFNRFGQQVTMTEDEFKYALTGRIALITEEQWDDIGFTEQEISLYSQPSSLHKAPDAFIQKRNLAHEVFRSNRESLKAGTLVPVADAVDDNDGDLI
jgi:hypothetical protein